LINRVDIYAAVAGQDADGGPTWTYPAVTRRAVACSAQPVRTDLVSDQDRLIRETHWKVMLPSSADLSVRGMLVITLPDGDRHTAYYEIEQDQAGRGAAYIVHAIERQ
jgi:hypothetical protein